MLWPRFLINAIWINLFDVEFLFVQWLYIAKLQFQFDSIHFNSEKISSDCWANIVSSKYKKKEPDQNYTRAILVFSACCQEHIVIKWFEKIRMFHLEPETMVTPFFSLDSAHSIPVSFWHRNFVLLFKWSECLWTLDFWWNC